MTPTRAQNRVRKKYGVGKGQLLARMRALRDVLYTYATDAAYRQVVHWESRRKAFRAIDLLSADSVIAAAYREAEKEEEVRDVKGRGHDRERSGGKDAAGAIQ